MVAAFKRKELEEKAGLATRWGCPKLNYTPPPSEIERPRAERDPRNEENECKPIQALFFFLNFSS